MATIFVASWAAQSIAGWASFNETRLQRQQAPLTWGGYVTNADFWARTLQNWQSEMLAVGSMVVLSIYLRYGLSAQRAFDLLCRLASTEERKLSVVAEAIVRTRQLP
jgi:hypothetical protein